MSRFSVSPGSSEWFDPTCGVMDGPRWIADRAPENFTAAARSLGACDVPAFKEMIDTLERSPWDFDRDVCARAKEEVERIRSAPEPATSRGPAYLPYLDMLSGVCREWPADRPSPATRQAALDVYASDPAGPLALPAAIIASRVQDEAGLALLRDLSAASTADVRARVARDVLCEPDRIATWDEDIVTMLDRAVATPDVRLGVVAEAWLALGHVERAAAAIERMGPLLDDRLFDQEMCHDTDIAGAAAQGQIPRRWECEDLSQRLARVAARLPVGAVGVADSRWDVRAWRGLDACELGEFCGCLTFTFDGAVPHVVAHKPETPFHGCAVRAVFSAGPRPPQDRVRVCGPPCR